MIITSWQWVVHTVNLDDDMGFDSSAEAIAEASKLIRDGFSVAVKSPAQNAFECLSCILDHDEFKVNEPDAAWNELTLALQERLQARECIKFIRNQAGECVNNMTQERLEMDLEDKSKILDMFSA